MRIHSLVRATPLLSPASLSSTSVRTLEIALLNQMRDLRNWLLRSEIGFVALRITKANP